MFRAVVLSVKLHQNLPLLQFKTVTCYVHIKSNPACNEKSSQIAALNKDVQSSSSWELHYLSTFLSSGREELWHFTICFRTVLKCTSLSSNIFRNNTSNVSYYCICEVLILSILPLLSEEGAKTPLYTFFYCIFGWQLINLETILCCFLWRQSIALTRKVGFACNLESPVQPVILK